MKNVKSLSVLLLAVVQGSIFVAIIPLRQQSVMVLAMLATCVGSMVISAAFLFLTERQKEKADGHRLRAEAQQTKEHAEAHREDVWRHTRYQSLGVVAGLLSCCLTLVAFIVAAMASAP